MSPDYIDNCTFAASAAAGALTIALKTQDGITDPSVASPSYLAFRSTALTSGAYVSRAATAPVSLTLAQGSTMGVPAAATPFALWAVLFDDAGSLRPALINCRGLTDIFPLNETGLHATVGEGNGAADDAGVFYTAAALSGVPFRIVTRFEWANGLAAVGVWENPTKVEPFSRGMCRPGEHVWSRARRFAEGSGSSSASTTPVDTNVTSGLFLLSSPANPIAWEFTMETTVITHGMAIYGNMTRGGINIGDKWIGAYGAAPTGTAMVQMVGQQGSDFPGSVGPHNLTVRAFMGGAAGTGWWNDSNGGGCIKVAEVMT